MGSVDYSPLEAALGHTYKDSTLLETALTHPSYAIEHHCQDNQRLEFLGDAILQLCTSTVLYERFPKDHEGQLTRRRAALVCEATLAKAASQLTLGQWLRLNHGEEQLGGRERASILADTMEAVIASVYLDAGLEAAAALIRRALNDFESPAQDSRDAKSRLQEYLQSLGENTPYYKTVKEEGPPNARVFTARVFRGDGTPVCDGQGTRKQWAEEDAASKALQLLKGQE